MKKRVIAILVCMVVMTGGTACSAQKDVPIESSVNISEVPEDTQISKEGKEQSTEETSIEETSTEETSIEETSIEETSIEETSVKEASVKEASTEESAEWLIENADLDGHIVNFSDSEISLAVATTETAVNGGEIKIAAATGTEDEKDLVHITYAENAVVQILTIDRKSEKKLSLKDVDKSSIKEQASVLIYGSCQNTYQWTADKIIIVKFV